MMVEIGHPGVQAQEFLSAFSSFEPLLTSLSSPCRSVFLLNNVVPPGCGDHFLVINVGQTRDLPDRSSAALRGRSVAVPLKEKIEHEPMLVDRPPQPMPNAHHVCASLVGVHGDAVLPRRAVRT